MAKIEELKFDDKNFNKHTAYGMGLLEKSLRSNGAGRSILIDKHNRIIAGNGIVEAAGSIGLEEVQIVETDGTKIVAVKRTDIDLDSKQGREMALADNATAAADLDWDTEQLASVAEDFGIDVQDWGITLQDIEQPFADDTEKEQHGKLTDKFIVPPFSVLDTKQGYWQERKNMWLQFTGNLSETRNSEFGRVGGKRGKSTIFDRINEGTSNFDPVLAEIICRWFCPAGGKVLDPFGGEQTKGVIAGELGCQYYAVEFRAEQVELNKSKTKKYTGVNYVCGDSNNIAQLITERGFDLCFTSPPYYDLEVYSKDDMSALGTYEEFMQQYENIFSQCVGMLADNAFLVVKVCEIRDKQTGIYRNFVGDNIALFNKLGLKYYNEIILYNTIGTAPVRANRCMNKRKVVKVHQNVLVFYKGDIEKLCSNMPQLNFNTDQEGEEIEEGEERAYITAKEGGVFFDFIKPIYEEFSACHMPKYIHGCSEFAEYISAATNGTGTLIADKPAPQGYCANKKNNAVLIAYTGGKDSTAEAIRLKAAGYEVNLLFIKGLNKAYPKELQCAGEIAKLIGCNMYTTDVKITGKNWHPDNPAKNQLILCLLTDWGIKNGFSNFSTGIINVPNPNYEYDWSDGTKVMEAFKKFMQKCCKGWNYVSCGVKHEAENLVEIITHPLCNEIWNAKSSCVGANRFRSTWRKANEDKFKIKLTENQCGSCYKCAYEYVVKCAVTNNVASAQYLKKCMGILRGEKAHTYDITKYQNNADWACGTFGSYIGKKVCDMLGKYNI